MSIDPECEDFVRQIVGFTEVADQITRAAREGKWDFADFIAKEGFEKLFVVKPSEVAKEDFDTLVEGIKHKDGALVEGASEEMKKPVALAIAQKLVSCELKHR